MIKLSTYHVLMATAIVFSTSGSVMAEDVTKSNKPLALKVLPADSEMLSPSEKILLVELKDDSFRLMPSDESRPAVRDVLNDLKVNASVGGRLLNRFWLVNLPEMRTKTDRAAIVEQLRNNPSVRSVSENKTYRPFRFNDPAYPNQVALYTGANQSAATVYDSEFIKLTERSPAAGERVVRIAVLDTGIAPAADLNGQFDVQANFVEGLDYDSVNNRFVLNSSEFASATEPSNSGANGAEPFYHGSKVQSLVNATADNNSGVVGLDRDIAISQVRVLADAGGNSIDVALGALWAVGLYDNFVIDAQNDPNYEFFAELPLNNNPADILNLSLGGVGSCSSFEQAAIDFIVNNSSALIVAASGNEGLYNSEQVSSAPANCSGVISVGASNTRLGDAPYSNVSPALVTSTLGGDSSVGDNLPVTEPSNARSVNGASFAAGTSFSTPLVSGVLATALKLGLNSGITNAQVINALTSTGYEFADPDSFCVQAADPQTNPRPCGTILNTSAFLLAVTGVDISAQQTSEPPPGGGTSPGPVDDTEPTQPVSGGDGDLPSQPNDPNPTETASVQFSGTVQNIDASTITLLANDSTVDASSYSVSFARETAVFEISLSIPGQYALSFEADRVQSSQSVQPAAAGQTLFVSDVVLDSGTRAITASDPMPASAGGGQTTSSPAPAGGGGGGTLGLMGLFGMMGLLFANRRMRSVA